LPRHRTDSIRNLAITTYQELGSAIAGDKILFECRMQPKIRDLARGSGGHRNYTGDLKKNAFAVLDLEYTNQQK